MDINIDNYYVTELLNLIKLSEENCNLVNTYNVIFDILKKIRETDDIDNKKKLLLFFRQCFYKICVIKDFTPSESMKKNIDNLIVYDIQIQMQEPPILPEKPYIGSLPLKTPDIVTVGSNVDQYARGLVNPLKRETIKNLLTIHSKFRNDDSGSSTDFSVILKEPFSNVISLKLASMEFMNSYYAISDYLKTNRFTIETYKLDDITNVISDFYQTEIQINEGGYTAYTLYPVINAVLDADPSLNMVTTLYNDIKGKIYFRIKPVPLVPPPSGKKYAFNLIFTLKEDIYRPLFLNMGWLFGFTQAKYTFLKDYVTTTTTIKEIGFNPEAPLDFTGTKYFLLEVTDYNNNAPAVLKYPMQDKYSFNIKDILAKIPNVTSTYSVIFEDSSDRIFKARHYFGPVKIQKLKIRLLDENGKIVNLNNSDVAISFEVESLDLPYKNMIK